MWFDDADAEAKLVQFLEDIGPRARLLAENAAFLDLGTGNGSLLFGLRDAGWEGRMLGVDYSAQSVALARRIAAARRTDSPDDEAVEFREHDILATPAEALLSGAQQRGWDVVLDKGTFDAISLSRATCGAAGRRGIEAYKARILPLVREGGLFLVTSCNWTEAELRSWFEGVNEEDDDETKSWRFEEAGKVAYPSFSYGGVKGQAISSLCFRKVKNAAGS